MANLSSAHSGETLELQDVYKEAPIMVNYFVEIGKLAVTEKYENENTFGRPRNVHCEPKKEKFPIFG